MQRCGVGVVWSVMVAGAALVVSGGEASVVQALPVPSESEPGDIAVSSSSATPVRLVDTRVGASHVTVDGLFEGVGRVSASGTLAFTVAGRAGVPTDASGVFVNVAAVAPDAAGFLTVFPCGEDRPLASNVNYAPGEVVANTVVSKIGAGGQVCVYSLAETDLVVDLNGTIPAGGHPIPVTPIRLLETRVAPGYATVDGLFEGVGRVSAGGTLALTVAGRAEVPADASGVVMNVAAVRPDAAGFLTVFPCGEDRPLASNVNYAPGEVVANTVVSKIGAGGQVCVYSLAETDLIADLNALVEARQGAFPRSPVRVLDTREGSAPVSTSWDGGPLAARSTLRLFVNDYPGSEILDDAILTVTAVEPEADGHLTVFPCGRRPLASNLNYAAGDVVANTVYTATGRGEVCIYTRAATHLVVDLNGYTSAEVLVMYRFSSLCRDEGSPGSGALLCDRTGFPAWVFDAVNLEQIHYDNWIEFGEDWEYGSPGFATLPPEFGNLTNLVDLTISAIRSPGLAALPSEFGKLTNLTTLNLAWNALATLPPEFGNLTKLSAVDLADNRLTSLPPEIGKLTELTTLDLAGNHLATLPPEIGDLASLTSLDLGGHKEVPDEVFGGTMSVFVGFNELTTLPAEVGNLAHLTTLDVTGNQLVALPPELGNLTQLEVLRAGENEIVTIPVEIGNLTNLRRLDLRKNRIAGDITAPMTALRLANPTIDLAIGGRGCPTISDPATLVWIDETDSRWDAGCT